MSGRHGVDCIEVGGPTAGTGCGGRGITKALELIGDPDTLRGTYDLVLFDVLGDVVCGGFSAPMRRRYSDEVYIVTSGEFRSLFAANNISQAVKLYARNGVRLGGLVANLKGLDDELGRVEKLAKSIDSRVMHAIPHDPGVAEAELRRVPIVDSDPTCAASVALHRLYDEIESMKQSDGTIPRPMTRRELNRLFLAT